MITAVRRAKRDRNLQNVGIEVSDVHRPQSEDESIGIEQDWFPQQAVANLSPMCPQIFWTSVML